MPTIYKSWDQLRERLLSCDNPSVEKRIGNDHTLVFEIDKLEYDANIPIIDDDVLERWLVTKDNSLLIKQPTKDNSLLIKQPPAPVINQPSISPPIKKRIKKTPKRGIQANLPTVTALWRCDTDQLVISEPIDDEYAKYDDDDEPESELSKNLRKIRTEPPMPKQPPPVTKQPPVIHPVTKAKENQKARPPPPTVPTQPTPIQSQPVPEPPKPPEPNWPETAKALQANQFAIVYKDLAFFKSKIMLNEQARTILKESVIKCIQEDETTLLTDILKLMYDLNYLDDCEFWSDLVKRLKRKVSTPGSNERPKYKAKTNPEWIFENYQRAIKSISDYARAVNLTTKLPFHLFLFLAFPLRDPTEVAEVVAAKAEPEKAEPVKVELAKVELTNVEPTKCESAKVKLAKVNRHVKTSDSSEVEPIRVEPMQEQCLNYPVLAPSVVNSTKGRAVKLVKKDDGNVIFMISKRKKK